MHRAGKTSAPLTTAQHKGALSGSSATTKRPLPSLIHHYYTKAHHLENNHKIKKKSHIIYIGRKKIFTFAPELLKHTKSVNKDTTIYMQKNLVIVESPAKAKTLEKFLGKDYKVLSSYGHIRDLKKKEMSVNLDEFSTEYEIPADKE